MRKILFKAKRINNGEWIEGNVFDDKYLLDEKEGLNEVAKRI